MENINTLIIIIVVLALIIVVLLVCGFATKQSPQDNENFLSGSGDNKYSGIGYSNENKPYDKPYVWKNFISPSMCEAIITASKNNLMESEVVGGKNKAVRNSQQYWIPKTDPLVKPLFDKVSQTFGIPIENAEDLQVVRYLPGQFYGEHHDACCDQNDKCMEFVGKGGQRKLTVLIYLNDNFTEGHTHFRNLNLKLKVPPGDAIVFRPLATNSSLCHPHALHAGMPVSSGVKWVANLWFRENKFTY